MKVQLLAPSQNPISLKCLTNTNWPQHIIMTTQNKADNKAKIGEDIKETTWVPDKGRVMMDITVKIISGIVPKGQIEGEVEVKVMDLGLTIIIMGNPQIKIPNKEVEEIKLGEGVMDIIYNIISSSHMGKIITCPRDNIPIWHSHKGNHKI